MAYEPLGGEFLVNSSTLNNQFEPSITALAGGGFVIVWSDNSDDGGDGSSYEVRAQLYASDGNPVGGEFLVNSITGGFQALPTVTGLAGGGFVISWTDGSLANGFSNSDDIRAQIFASDGSPVGSEFQVNSTIYNFQEFSTVAGLEGGGFVISWNDGSLQNGDSTGTGVKAQIFASDGSPVGGEFQVNTTTSNFQDYPTIAGLGGGGFVIAWSDASGMGGDSSGTSIKAQMFASDGSPVGGEFLVNSVTASDQYSPTIAALNGGGFVVSWQAWNETGTHIDIKAQMFASDGSPVGGEFLVNGETLSNLTVPTVTGLDDGGFVISWVDSYGSGADPSDFGIKAQIFSSGGSPVGGEFLVNSAAYSSQFQPTITGIAGGGFVVSWSDNGGDGSGYAVKAQIYISDSEPVGQPPIASDDSVAVAEDSGGNDLTAQLLANDTDPENDTRTIVIGSNGAHGTVSVYAGVLTYTPDANYNGTDTFTYTIDDGNGNQDTATVNVTVTAVNDPVTGTVPASATLSEDSVNVSITGLSIADADATLAPAGVYEVVLSASDGAITMTTLTGLTFTTGAGSNDATMAFHGTLANINTALATAKYTPPANFNGPASITMDVTDTFGGIVATGTGVATNSSDVLNIDVVAVNDSPELNVSTPVTATAQTLTSIFTGAAVADVDLDARNGGQGDYAGAVFSVNRSPASNPVDDFTLASGTNFTVEGINLKTGGLTFGHISADGNGVFAITFTSLEAVATSALVDEVISSVQYSYTGDFPPPSVTLAAGFTDGAPGGGQGSGDSALDVAFVTVNIGPGNILSLGNLVWSDTDGDGAKDPGEAGIAGVSVSLFADDGNGILDGADTLLGTTTSDSSGIYAFTGLAEGDYIVRVDAANFAGGGALEGLTSTPGGDDPDNNVDFDDNGIPAADAVASRAITLRVDQEPTPGTGNNTNNTVDFGFVEEAPVEATGYQPVGGEFQVSSITEYQQYDPSVAELGTGGFVVTWQGNGIIGQIYAADGSAVGDEFLIASNGGGQTVTSLENGGFAVGWYDNSGIKAQMFSADGTPTGDAFLVNTPKAELLYQPTITSLSGGGIVVSWTDQSGDGSQYGVRARVFDPSGNPVGTEFVVNTVTSSAQVYPTITGLGSGGFVVSWTDYSGIGGDNDHSGIKAQVFAADGTRVGGEFLVNTATFSEQGWPTITALSNGGFVVSWFDYSWQGGDPDQGAVKAQVYAADGTPVGGELLVNTTTAGQQGQPSVAALSDGGFVVSWMDGSNVTPEVPDWDIRAQAFAADGSKVGGEILVNTVTEFYQNDPSVSGISSGGFVVTWADFSADPDFGSSQIKAQIFAPDNGTIDQPADARDDAFSSPDLSLVTGNLFADNGSGADSDPDGPALSITAVNGNGGNVGVPFTLASGAELTVNVDGTFSYQPNAATQIPPTTDSFNYTLAGGDTATVTLNVNTDAIIGNGGPNRLIGGGGDDNIYGLGGDDYLTGGFGNDLINGGDGGSDRAGWYQTNEALGGATVDLRLQGQAQNTGSQGWDTLSGIENLSGTPFADNLTGDSGDNWLWGSGSYLFGEQVSTTNNDMLDGQGGNDLLTVGGGNHVLIGGEGSDTVRYTENGGPEADIVLDLNVQGAAQGSGAGNWTLSGIENLSSGEGDDVLTGDGNANVLAGGAGSDSLDGAGGDDQLYGDGTIAVDSLSTGPITEFPEDSRSVNGVPDGDDLLFGGGGNDTLYGGGGNDQLRGGGDNDTVYGGTGDDLIVGGFGDDVIAGGEGYDRAGNYHVNEALGGVTIDLNIVGAQNTGSQGWDTLTGIEYLSGTPFADILVGDAGNNILWGSAATIDPETSWVSTTNNDTLNGGDGDDLLYVGIGNHTLTGGSGIDTVAFTENWGDDPAITVNLALQGSAQDTGQGLWTLTGIENLSGGNDNDTLTGNGGANILAGSFGNDTLNGGGGSDSLYGDGVFDSSAPSSGAPTLFADVGADGNDTLNGGGGDDSLYGGGGNDRLVGGGGNDSNYGGAGNDYITGGFGDDLIDGGDGIDRAGWYQVDEALGGATVDLRIVGAQNTGSQGWDTLTGIENLSGTPYADVLIGDDNANWLWGSPATIDFGWISTGNNDTLDGQGGNDLLTVGIGNHTLIGGTGIDTVRFTENGFAEPGITLLMWEGLAQDTGAGTWTLSGIENASAGIGDDYVEGTGAANVIAGDLGNDILFGLGGADLLIGDGYINIDASSLVTTVLEQGAVGGNDSLNGGGGDDTLYGGGGHDGLRGAGGNDASYGGSGDDFINGGFGDDIVDGGVGYDRAGYYQADQALGGITVSLLLQGVSQYTGSQGWDTLVSIENVSGTPFADTITGDANDNWLWGSAAWIDAATQSTSNNDTIDGGGGNDLITVGYGNHNLAGGSGIDTISFQEPSRPDLAVTISLALQGAAQDTGQGSWVLSGFENVSGYLGNDTLTGNGNTNILLGGGGGDSLNGGAGDDTLYGDGQMGIDSHGTGGSGSILLTADVASLGGVSGDDTLEGGLGDDTIDGGGGTDTASYANASGGVEVFLYKNGGGEGESGGADGFDLLYGIENITGSAFADQLAGNNLANVIDGGEGADGLRGYAGNDTLLGGGGNDFLNGGLGDDIVNGGAGYDRAAFYEDAGPSGVTVDLSISGPQDTGQGMDTLIGIENVSGSIYGDHLTGDNGDNQLWGSASTLTNGTIVTTNNDSLSGGGGNDLLVVGIGNHTVDGGSGIDTFRFTENGAPETGITLSLMQAGLTQATGNGNWTLTNIENLSGSIAGDNLAGDGNDNVLAGDLGNDTLGGGGGNDILYGDGAIAVNAPGSGPITTYADVVASFGGVSGNDILDGGDGNDQLWGGGGNDTATFASATGNVTALLYDGGFGEAFGAAGYDQLHDIENLTGSPFNDILYANNLDNIVIGGSGHDDVRGLEGNDQVYGGDGDDLLYGNAGDDYLDGGAGYDRVGYFSGATAGVTVDLNQQGTAQNTGQGWDTLVGIENVSGTQFGDTLIGDNADNVIWGSASTVSGVVSTENNDTLIGNGGNDLLIAGIGNHMIDGGSGTDTFRFSENGAPETGITLSLLIAGAQATANGTWTLVGIENLSGSIAGDNLIGDGNANVLAGDLGNDSLVGGAGNDTLFGDGQIMWDDHGAGRSGPITTFADATSRYVGGIAGNDTLEGGLGDDLIDGGGGSDTASYEHASGGVDIDLGAAYATGADGDDTLINIENLIGSEFSDGLGGDAGANVLDGRGGNDFIVAGGGNDVVYGGDGNDTIQGDYGDTNITAIGNDLVYGGNGNDSLRGGLGNDQLFGGANNDLLRGNGGVDYFDGGADDGLGVNGIGDRVSFFEQRATQGVVADLRTGIISNDGYGNVETMVGIESLGADTAFVDTFYGNDGSNYLAGNRGDNLYGFGGDDLIQMTSAAGVVDGGAGTDRLVLANVSGWLTPDSNGDGLAEIMSASTAGWTINLAAGTTLDGYGNAGTITGIEIVDGTVLADTILGDGNVNVLNGGDGDDTLGGGLGSDTLDGGNGIDTASYANASGGVTVTLTASGGSSSGADGSDTLISIENAMGSAFNDTLTGNAGANLLSGGDGHDALSGGAGNDTLQGGAGNDSLTGGAGDDVIDGGAGFDRVNYNVGATTGVTVNLALVTAQNTGQGMDTLAGVENLVGTIFNDVLTGNDGDNWIWGGSLGTGVTGNDTISGGNGNDLIEVGTGNHTLNGGNGTDTLSFLGGTTDITATGVAFSLATVGAQNTRQGTTTASGFENLSGSVRDDALTGSSGNNVLAGNTGADTLNGGLGNDSLYGDGGYTVYTTGGLATGPIRLVTDVTTEFGGIAGNDTLNGGDGDDRLFGGGGDDFLKGDKDNDTLFGGTGNDNLVGGQGNDRYVIEANSGADKISGFAHVDRIVFDASTGVTSFSALTLTQVNGSNTRVTWGDGNSIVIEGFKPKDITAADFEFAPAASFLASRTTAEQQRVLADSGSANVLSGALAASGLSATATTVFSAEGATIDPAMHTVSSGLLPQSGFGDLAGSPGFSPSLPIAIGGLAGDLFAEGLHHSADALQARVPIGVSDGQFPSAPTDLLEATQYSALPVGGFTAASIGFPSAALMQLAAEHGTVSAGPTASLIDESAAFAVIRDAIGAPGRDSIETLLDALPDGGHSSLASLTSLPAVEVSSSWTLDAGVHFLALDPLVTHQDSIAHV